MTKSALEAVPASATSDSPMARYAMPVTAACLLAGVVFAVCISFHWPLVHDAPLMHYVVFLMDHGRAPYRDIVEMNMPGSYMLEWAVLHTLGGGAQAWWLWDTLSGLAAILASAWISGPQKRSAGLAAGALCYLFHLAEGPGDLGQRDWIVAVLFLLAMGCLFRLFRSSQPAWMAGFAAFSTLAALIKPPVFAIAILFFFACLWHAGRIGRPPARLVPWAALGALLPGLAAILFLWHWGITRDFVETLRGLVPYYSGLQNLPLTLLVRKAVPYVFQPLFFCACGLTLANRSWRNWETRLLVAGALSGMALFLSQRKGWDYHLGLELAFLGLWAMIEFDRSLASTRARRMIAAAALVIIVCWTLPLELRKEQATQYSLDTVTHLENDLDRLGGAALSGHIQCLDMTMGGCINVLYRKQLVQSTGFIYDFYLFPTQPGKVTAALQSRFLQAVDSSPPQVIVLSSHIWPGDFYGYQMLDTWPQFHSWLDQRYRLAKEEPAHGAAGYRIYLLNR